MVAGEGTPDQAPARMFAYRDPETFRTADRSAGRGLDRISGRRSSRPAPMWCRFSTPGPACCRRSDSIAGAIAADAQDRRRRARASAGRARSSAFRAAPARWRSRYVEDDRRRRRRPRLDGRPRILRASGAAARCRCRAMSIRWRCWPAARRSTARSTTSWRRSAEGPLIFNLGHGILPATPIAHVERMLKRVRGG